jgi:GxxExxY protein
MVLGETRFDCVRKVFAAGVAMPSERDQLNQVTDQIIAAAIAVHRVLGPGLLESAYEPCLAYEMAKRGLTFEQQKPLPVMYDNVQIDCAYRLDFVVNGDVIVETKAVRRISDVHVAQVLSYLRLLNKRVGLLINFNVKRLVDGGVRRIVNNFPE